LVPNNFQGVPVPEQAQAGLKQIRFNNIASQCQAAFPELNPGDSDQTCRGPTSGDSALGFVGSGANARVYSTGDEVNPTQTHTAADSRAGYADLTGLQSASVPPTQVQSLSGARMKDVYPIFCLLLLATSVAARLQKIPSSRQAG
jgi:hypothetical protein